MKIVFIGTVELSRLVLRSLIKYKSNIISVITLKKSAFNADYAALSKVCSRYKIECFFADHKTEREIRQYLKMKNPDFIFCIGWSRLLSDKLLSIPRYGVIGFHPALLPKNRGRHPLIWALALGLKETGSTFFMMNRKADAGDIISQKKIKISYSDDAKSLYEKVAKTAVSQVNEFMPLLERGKLKKIKQDSTKASYWRKRLELDGVIDWRMSSYGIYNLVRALTRPYVGAHFLRKGKKIKVWKAAEIKRNGFSNCEPGKVLKIYKNGSLLVKAQDNCIKVLEIEPKVTIKIGEYL